MRGAPTWRFALLALMVLVFDQLTKWGVRTQLDLGQEVVLVEGFFKLVHWVNRGAAWSLFDRAQDSNRWLAVFALLTLLVLFLTRHHFDIHTTGGQTSLGLIFGGVTGNLVDRFTQGHVVDFLYFFLERRGGDAIGFPAFNLADIAICSGVGLLFLLSWQKEEPTAKKPDLPRASEP